jgi:histidinol-phosphatase
MIDAVMRVWDNAPLQPIVEEAGGRFTDLAGNATIHGGSALSTNGLLHESLLGLLKT